ncbi:type IV secretion system protein TraC [Burkholderia multivorans]|uniref:type IV secretion system protein TraC n=1 Tax=Burkholderia multivorans TaxID=87883 RepID=UPI002866180F|nr:type IV secretion system protein TraC [Burkholderia multivorans]MDR9065301.1 Protein TraC [Burkholderia multivorans]MDR9091833.1 Protein TraC [Burkholderia multivorans]MDR9119894.1 Protein TraC [Burkholderia multivorans]MDR9157274.1 Protein TraC [Burkholderia multivorans]MDR9166715.1 Protein TraC [Burkholderia multivorans]
MLDALKTIFYGERFAPADAVPRALLERIAQIPRLTGILPYLGWMQDEKLFALDQGVFGGKPEQNIGFCIETMPQTGSNEEMERVLGSLFMSCPPGTGIQVSLYASPHILPVLRDQASRLPVDGDKTDAGWEDRRNRNVFRAMARRRIEYYLEGTGKSLFSHHVYLLRNYRCVISITTPLNPSAPADVEEAIRIRESAHATLRSAHLPGWDWGPNDLLNFVADFFDHERVFGRAADKPIEYDESRPLRSQLSNLEIASSVADSFIKFRKGGGEETALQCFSVRQYPRYYRLGNMGALIGDYYQMALAIPCPFLITMGAIILDYESARTKAQMKAARATQAAGSYMAHFQPDLQDRKRDWDMVLRAFDNGRNVVQMYHQIVLISRLEEAARSEHAVRAVWRARGFDLAKDVYLQHQALVAAMPCTLTPALQKDLQMFGRAGTKTADNAVMTAPLIAEWKGTETPTLTLFGRRGQIMTFDLFDNKGGNYNFAVAALSGSGKSVLVNEMAFRYLGTGTKVWIIDVGRSYRNLCELLDGEFIEFSDERSNTICLNPFSMVLDINKDMEMLLPLIAQMASPREPLDNFGYSALAGAIKRVWDQKGRDATISDVYDLLKTGRLSEEGEHERDLARLATALEPYTRYGVYASYFEGEANIEFHKNLVVLELEELKSKKDLQAVVMQLMMYRITQEMYLDRSKRKLVIIDEAWDLMSSGSSASFIEAGYRRARKYGGAFGTITQSVEDYYKNEATKAAIQNADWLFLLRQKPESIERLGKEGKLHVDEWMKRQLSSVATEHGYYSEIFVHGPMGSGVGRLILDPFSMLLYSTRAEDFQAIKALTDQGVSVAEAIDEILKRRGLH